MIPLTRSGQTVFLHKYAKHEWREERKDETNAGGVMQQRWRRRAVFKVKENFLISFDMQGSEHIETEGNEGAAMNKGESLT